MNYEWNYKEKKANLEKQIPMSKADLLKYIKKEELLLQQKKTELNLLSSLSKETDLLKCVLICKNLVVNSGRKPYPRDDDRRNIYFESECSIAFELDIPYHYCFSLKKNKFAIDTLFSDDWPIVLITSSQRREELIALYGIHQLDSY